MINEHTLRKYKEVVFIKNKMSDSKKTKLKENIKNDPSKCGYEREDNNNFVYYLGNIYNNITEDDFKRIIDNICHICEDEETEKLNNKIICGQCKNKFCDDCKLNIIYNNFCNMKHSNSCPYCNFDFIEFDKELIIKCIDRKINENNNNRDLITIRREVLKIFMNTDKKNINNAASSALTLVYHILHGGSLMFNINSQTGEQTVIFIDNSDIDGSYDSDDEETAEQTSRILEMQKTLKINMRLNNKQLHIMKYNEFLKFYNVSIRTKNGILNIIRKIVEENILLEPYTYTELLNITNQTDIFNFTDDERQAINLMLGYAIVWDDMPDNYKQHV